MRFRRKERGTRVKDREKNGASKIYRAVKTESPLPQPFSVFLCSETKRKRLLRRLTDDQKGKLTIIPTQVVLLFD